MSKPFTKAQEHDIAHKAAMIANTAFAMGRGAESARIIAYLREQVCEVMRVDNKCTDDTCWLIMDILAYVSRSKNP